MALFSRLFGVCPRLAKADEKLVATSAWRVRILTAGGLYRQVVVDPQKNELTISRRYLWAFPRRRRIKFEAVQAVTYRYEDLSLDAYLKWVHDSLDLFSVGLRLSGDEELHLFYFFGDGTITNDGPLPDWLYWGEQLFDTSGLQERESRLFVDQLAKMIGVPVVAGRAG